jgi:hypothetical protein
MHHCPECGQACYCAGDIDDIECRTAAWVYRNCACCAGCDDENDECLDCGCAPCDCEDAERRWREDG